MTQRQHPFHYYRSPAEIREVQFSHRVRGLDEYEVAEYLDLLADQVHATDLELERLRDERDRLRADNERLRTEGAPAPALPPSHTSPEATPRAAALLMNAQRVADDLVEEAVRRARDMLTVARAEKNAIIRNAQETAAAMLVEARGSSASRHAAPLDSPSGSSYSSGTPYSSRESSPGSHYATRDASPGSNYATRDTAPSAQISPQRSWQLDGQAAV